MRDAEAAKQAAILNALPVHSPARRARAHRPANETWQQLAGGSVLLDAAYGVGVNYLGICESVPQNYSADAQRIAAGIRRVLAGQTKHFSTEYSCDPSNDGRWYLLTVTPLAENRPSGVIVMHVDITGQKRGEEAIQRFAAAMDASADAIYLVDRSSMRFVHVNEAACRAQAQTRAGLLALMPAQVLAASARTSNEPMTR